MAASRHINLSLAMFTSRLYNGYVALHVCFACLHSYIFIMSSSPAVYGNVLDHEPLRKGNKESSIAALAALGVEECVFDSVRQLPSLSSSSTEPPVCGIPKRVCSTPKCRRIKGSTSHNPHDICISCHHGTCCVGKRCTERFD